MKRNKNIKAVSTAAAAVLALAATATSAFAAQPAAEAATAGTWSLVNFAIMDIIAFEAIMLLIGYFVNIGNESDTREVDKKPLPRVISVPVAVITGVVFLFTENIGLATGMIDRWTLLFAILLVIQTLLVYASRKEYADEEAAAEAAAEAADEAAEEAMEPNDK